MIDFSRIGNGLECYILQNNENVNKVVTLFKSAIDQGFNPCAIESDVYAQANVNPADFFPNEKIYIENEVSKYWSEHKC